MKSLSLLVLALTLAVVEAHPVKRQLSGAATAGAETIPSVLSGGHILQNEAKDTQGPDQ